MQLKLLSTAALVLCLSTLASSNECASYAHRCADKCPAKTAESAKPATQTHAATADTESATLIINKLLYI